MSHERQGKPQVELDVFNDTFVQLQDSIKAYTLLRQDSNNPSERERYDEVLFGLTYQLCGTIHTLRSDQWLVLSANEGYKRNESSDELRQLLNNHPVLRTRKEDGWPLFIPRDIIRGLNCVQDASGVIQGIDLELTFHSPDRTGDSSHVLIESNMLEFRAWEDEDVANMLTSNIHPVETND